MNSKAKGVAFLSVALQGICCLAFSAHAAGPAEAPAGNTAQPLAARATAFRSELLPYEPLRLHVTIHNPGKTVQTIGQAWRYAVRFECRRMGRGRAPDGEWSQLPRFLDLINVLVVDDPAPIHPGVTAAHDFWLFCAEGDETPMFEEGEEYEVRAIVSKNQWLKADLISAPARVVVPKVAQAEAAAFGEVREAAALAKRKGLFLAPLLIGLFSFNSDLPFDQFLAQLDGFIQRHPNSAYSIHYRRIYVEAVRYHTPRGQPLPERAAEKERWLKQNAAWIDAADPPPPADPASRPAGATRPVGRS